VINVPKRNVEFGAPSSGCAPFQRGYSQAESFAERASKNRPATSRSRVLIGLSSLYAKAATTFMEITFGIFYPKWG